MSETKFTPGPWSAITRGHETHITDGAGDSLAELHPEAWDDQQQSCKRFPIEANAHLIAAAPELYAQNENAALALEEAAKLLRARGMSGCADIMDRQAVRCRDALSKARGSAAS